MATIANETLHCGTRNDVLEALRGEALAYVRYRLCARAARRHGRRALADLFELTALVERDDHFRRLAELVELAGDDEAALAEAIACEDDQAETIYPEYAERAARAGDLAAAELFAEIARDERRHRAAFEAALAGLEAAPEILSSPR